ncbi:membrane protein [Pseudomonas duriflava]|uniref:Membrane protein n=1 Tax=Pseudomonas duriflava TaxID=459528 RepID=A0A562QMQ5_9PSED|nr:YihY/virulence factor BrkB family protein [Pseudomonas duriflava]TWI57480.1 membrane protein [Pseudomonas duriflava]
MLGFNLRGVGAFTLFKKALKEFSDDDMTTYASALAYQIFFSMFPFILFLISLVGFLNLPNFFDWLREQANLLLPGQALEQVNPVIDQLQQSDKGGLLSVGIIIALWSASGAVRSLMTALNTAYDVEEGRPIWKRLPLSVLYTIGLAVMLISAAALMVTGPQILNWMAGYIGLEQMFITIWAWARWPVAVILLMLAVAVIYYVAPDVEQDFRFITPGSVLAVIVWIAASLGFAYYVQNFSNYNAMYGSIGTIIILLLYLYISSAVLLFGAEINAVIEHHSDEGKREGDKKLDG